LWLTSPALAASLSKFCGSARSGSQRGFVFGIISFIGRSLLHAAIHCVVGDVDVSVTVSNDEKEHNYTVVVFLLIIFKLRLLRGMLTSRVEFQCRATVRSKQGNAGKQNMQRREAAQCKQ